MEDTTVADDDALLSSPANPWAWCTKKAPTLTPLLIQKCLTPAEREQRDMYVLGMTDERLRVALLVQALIDEYHASAEPAYALGELLMQIVRSETRRG